MDSTNNKPQNAALIEHVLGEYKEAIEKIEGRLDALDRRYALKIELDNVVALRDRDIESLNESIEDLNAKLNRRVIGTGIMTAVVTSIITALATHIVEGLI